MLGPLLQTSKQMRMWSVCSVHCAMSSRVQFLLDLCLHDLAWTPYQTSKQMIMWTVCPLCCEQSGTVLTRSNILDDFEPVGWKMEPIASIIIIGDGFVIHLSGKISGNDDVFPMIDSRLTHDSAVDTEVGAGVSTAGWPFLPKKSWIMSAWCHIGVTYFLKLHSYSQD